MKKSELQQKVAHLEFIHDQLETELCYIDRLLKKVGFPNGVDSAKQVALELIDNEQISVNKNREDGLKYDEGSSEDN